LALLVNVLVGPAGAAGLAGTVGRASAAVGATIAPVMIISAAENRMTNRRL
jgi:hypothetical protein